MADDANARMLWDSVIVRVTDVRHGVLLCQRIEEIDENSLFLFVSGKGAQVLVQNVPYALKASGLFHIGRNRRIVIDPIHGEVEYFLAAYHPECPQNAGREMARMLIEESPFEGVEAVQPANIAFFALHFKQMESAWNNPTREDRLLLKSAFYAVVHGFYAEKKSAARTGISVDVVEWTQRYLREHFAEANSVQALADALKISRSSLHEQFCRRIGVSPRQYLTNLRLEAAQKALRESALTIQEIAASCGLRDKNHFFRMHRQRFGMTPGEYRGQFQTPAQSRKPLEKDAPQGKRSGLLIENFGRIHRYHRVPSRVVCLGYAAAEICAALGAASSIVGISEAEDSIADCVPAYREALSAAPHLPGMSNERRVPRYETVCACRPDLVVGTSYAFYENSGVADAAAFERSGVHIYALKATYRLNGTFEDVYEDILNLGRILGREARAEECIAGMRRREEVLRDMRAKLKSPVRVFAFDGEMRDGAFTCGQSLENHMIRCAGGRNIFEDRRCQFASVSWQEVAQADPEVILVHRFYDGDDGERKIALLRSRAEIAGTGAMRHGRIHSIGIKRVFPAIDNVEAALQMAEWFHLRSNT